MSGPLRKMIERRKPVAGKSLLMDSLVGVLRTANSFVRHKEDNGIVMDRTLSGHWLALRESCERASAELARQLDN
jgi:hypothetical protein